MKSTPTPRARFIAVIALIVVVGAGGLVLLNTQGTKSAKSHLITTHTSTGTNSQTTNTTGTIKTTTTTAKPRPKPKPKPKPSPLSVATALDGALLNHPVVVVSLYSPDVATDTAAMNEAKAGAAAVSAGFVAFNIYDEKLARQLASLLGASFNMSNPEVLFFKRPRTLAFELQGFVDSQVVAQAASNLHPAVDFWVSEANGICAHYSKLSSAISWSSINTATNAQAAKNFDEMASLLSKEAAALSRVRVSNSHAAEYARLIASYQLASRDYASLAQTVSSKGKAAAMSRLLKESNALKKVPELAYSLQLTSCVSQ